MDAIGMAEVMVVAAIVIFAAFVTAPMLSLKIWPMQRPPEPDGKKAEHKKLMEHLVSEKESSAEC